MSNANEIYSLKYREDIYYTLTRVTKDNIVQWKQCLTEENCAHDTMGWRAFNSQLAFYDNTSTEVWVASAASAPCALNGLEMVMAVSTSSSPDATLPFTSHMGIQRIKTDVVHSKISIALHSFAASVMMLIHPEKLYMLNTPADNMREILVDACKQQGKVQDTRLFSDQRITKDQYDKAITFLATEQKKGDPIKAKMWIDLYESQQRCESGSTIPVERTLLPNKEIEVVIDGKTISSEEKNLEYAWFFNDKNHTQAHGYPGFAIKLDSLAELVTLPVGNLVHYDLDEQVS